MNKKDEILVIFGEDDIKNYSKYYPYKNPFIYFSQSNIVGVDIEQAIEDYFIVEDLHNFGADYDKTLMAWYQNFQRHWPKFSAQYGEKFYRMWKYYLLSCAGAFRARDIQLWQWVLSKKGVLGGYRRPAF